MDMSDVERAASWLVRYQVKGESLVAIAQSAGVGAEEVRLAITDFAALIELELRSDEPDDS